MFKRTNLLALAMLGLGTLLGYTAAWGKLPIFDGVHATAADSTGGAPALNSNTPRQNVAFAQNGGGKWIMPKPDNPRGATTGPTQAPGYDHPNQYTFTSSPRKSRAGSSSAAILAASADRSPSRPVAPSASTCTRTRNRM